MTGETTVQIPIVWLIAHIAIHSAILGVNAVYLYRLSNLPPPHLLTEVGKNTTFRENHILKHP